MFEVVVDGFVRKFWLVKEAIVSYGSPFGVMAGGCIVLLGDGLGSTQCATPSTGHSSSSLVIGE